MAFVYPGNDIDRPLKLLAALGSLWNDVYDGRDQILADIAGLSHAEQQTQLDLLEAMASVSRLTVPIFHRENWTKLSLKQSERNDSQTSLLRFDEDGVFDGADSFDVPRVRAVSAFPLPANLVTAPLLTNRILQPSWTMAQGVDFSIDAENQAIVFVKNPLEDPRAVLRPIFRDGVPADYELVFWIFKGQFDLEAVYKHFGYVLSAKLKSSRGYRDLMNAVFDAIVGGTAHRQLATALSAMSGIPVIVESQETVQVISDDAHGTFIATDRNVYRFHADAEPTVAVDDVLLAGSTMTTGLRIQEFNRGETPADLQALSFGSGFMAAGFFDELVFENKDVTLVVDEAHVSGYTYVSFAVGGHPLDVQKFFDDLHTNGVAAGETLAMLLDVRETPAGQPTADNLPQTINPLQFLIKNVLRNNTFLVRVKINETAGDVGLQNLWLLHRIVPPHTAMIILIELQPTTESVTIDRVHDETMGTFAGAEPLSEGITVSSVREGVLSARLVSESCQ